MGSKEWLRYHNAWQLVNAEEVLREQVRNGTYAGREPIADEWQLDQMLKQARNEIEAGKLFHFDNALNHYDLAHYAVESEEERWARLDRENDLPIGPDEDEHEEPRRGGLLGWLFGR